MRAAAAALERQAVAHRRFDVHELDEGVGPHDEAALRAGHDLEGHARHLVLAQLRQAGAEVAQDPHPVQRVARPQERLILGSHRLVPTPLGLECDADVLIRHRLHFGERQLVGLLQHPPRDPFGFLEIPSPAHDAAHAEARAEHEHLVPGTTRGGFG